MAKRPDLSFPGSLTGRQWGTVEAIEARGDYVLVRRDTLAHLVDTHEKLSASTACAYLDEARRDLARTESERNEDGCK